LFSLLPASLGAPIVVAQHLSIGFGATLVQWLGSLTQLQVCEGADDQALRPGLVVIAPAGRHMEVAEEGRVRLSDAPPVHGCRPSADVLFDSVARLYGASAVAAILTGMGQDGALGLKAIKAAGGRTLAQDEATSVIFGMPKAAIQLGAVDRVLPLDSLAEEIARLVGHCPASTASAS
jgi:two-component system chemotaxis response regulator CheB